MTKQAEEEALKTDVASTTPAGSGPVVGTDAAPGSATGSAATGGAPIQAAGSPSG